MQNLRQGLALFPGIQEPSQKSRVKPWHRIYALGSVHAHPQLDDFLETHFLDEEVKLTKEVVTP